MFDFFIWYKMHEIFEQNMMCKILFVFIVNFINGITILLQDGVMCI